MKAVLLVVLFIIAIVNINGCSQAKKEYENCVASQNGWGGFADGFVDGYTGTTSFSQLSQNREQQLAAEKNRRFTWACVWTAVAVVVTMSGNSKKKASLV
jgi:branched-subunit amino acid permease